MPQCNRYDCNRDLEGNLADGLCILHSTDPAKDAHVFAEALAAHREHKGDKFVHFIFPGGADFRGASFNGDADFEGATFSGIASFIAATFSGRADFEGASFNGDADFEGATFSGIASFIAATFSGRADFEGARFNGDADFERATFSGHAYFTEAAFNGNALFARTTFNGNANFMGAAFTRLVAFLEARFGIKADFVSARFSGDTLFIDTRFSKGLGRGVDFIMAVFSGRTLFTGRQGGTEVDHIFAGTEVDFRHAIINSPDAVTFLKADLTQCQFLNTDLRKVQLVDVKWPQKGQRVVVYDELDWLPAGMTRTQILLVRLLQLLQPRSARSWSQIEQLYRALKQNYEDRRDYERAGDFHYGEKEMRRQNPDTTRGLRFFLMLYWLFSGYGERYLRPLLWAGLLFAGSTFGYMSWGLRPKNSGSTLVWTNKWDWLQGAFYSFQVMTFLKPDDWVPVGYAHVIYTFQTLLGPLFLGLFALALRQRLKR